MPEEDGVLRALPSPRTHEDDLPMAGVQAGLGGCDKTVCRRLPLRTLWQGRASHLRRRLLDGLAHASAGGTAVAETSAAAGGEGAVSTTVAAALAPAAAPPEVTVSLAAAALAASSPTGRRGSGQAQRASFSAVGLPVKGGLFRGTPRCTDMEGRTRASYVDRHVATRAFQCRACCRGIRQLLAPGCAAATRCQGGCLGGAALRTPANGHMGEAARRPAGCRGQPSRQAWTQALAEETRAVGAASSADAKLLTG